MMGLFSKLIFPIYERRTEPRAKELLRTLRNLEHGSRQAVRAHQEAALARLLVHASANSPYYQQLRVLGAAQLTTFPILTKTLLRQHHDELLVRGADVSKLTKNASGGSTGQPVNLFQDRNYWDYAYAFQTLAESWWGIKRGMRSALLWGADRDFSVQSWRERLPARISQVRGCNVFKTSEKGLREFAGLLERWKPQLLVGYASALRIFAEYCQRNAVQVRPIAIKSTAEVLFPEERTLIEETFGAPVYNYYGSREINNLAAECQSHEGMHVNEFTRVIEIVDEEGRPTPPEVPGRVLVTDLTNLAMPIIRYENEDIAQWSAKDCSCGRPLRLLSKLHGRKSDFISTPEGKLIHGEFFTHMFYDLPQISSFRISQETPETLAVTVVLVGVADKGETMHVVERRCASAMGDKVRVSVQEVSTLDRTETGKHRFTVSKVPITWSKAQIRNSYDN